MLSLMGGLLCSMKLLQRLRTCAYVYLRNAILRIGVRTVAGVMDALPGYLLPDTASQSRIPLLLRRLEDLAKLYRRRG